MDETGRPSPVDLSRGKAWLGLVLIFVAVGICWHLWMGRDVDLPRGDENRYLAAADRANRIFHRPSDSALQTLKALGEVHPTHPPLFPVLAGAAMEVTGRKLNQVMVLQLLFLGLLLVAVYNTGRILSNRSRGLAAAALTAAFPLTFRYTHEFFLELPTAALVAAAMWLLVAWRAYGGWGRGLGLGVFIAMGLLTKWTFPVFLLLPGLFLLDRLRRHRDPGAMEVWGGFFLGLAIPIPWFILHYERIVQFFSWNQAHPYWHLADLSSMEGWFFYLKILPHMMGGLPFVLVCIGIAVALSRLRRERVVLGWLVLPLLVFTLMRTKAFDGRHLLPALPAAALLGALVVLAPWRWARAVAWAAVLAAVPLSLLPGAGLALRHTLRGVIPGTDYSIVGLYQEPEASDFGAGKVHSCLHRAMEEAGKSRADVVVLAAFRSLNAGALGYLARLEGQSLSAFTPEPRPAGEAAAPAGGIWKRILEADFVVVKEGLPVDSNLNGYRRDVVLWSDFHIHHGRNVRQHLEKVGEVVTPDGDRVCIYRRSVEADRAAKEEGLRWYLRTRLEGAGEAGPRGAESHRALQALASLVEESGAAGRARALETLASILSGQSPGTVEAFRALVRQAPEEPWVVLEAARALNAANHPDEAVAVLEAGSGETFLAPFLHRLRGRIDLARAQPASAVEAWRKEARLDRRSPDVYRRLARAYDRIEGMAADRGKRTLEIADLKAALSASPRDCWREAADLGRRFRLRDPEEALFHLRGCVLAAPMQDPTALQAFQLWMDLMRKAGRVEEVKAYLERRVSVETDGTFRQKIQGLLEKLGGE